jgi:hypothetical protein
MKNIFRLTAALLACLLALTAVPARADVGFQADDSAYVIESYEPNGYCYLYDAPDDTNGRNLGRHDNGETVWVIQFSGGNHYAYVVCSDGTAGYVHDYVLTPYDDTVSRPVYQVYSTSPAGYCYLYDAPDDTNGRNLGRYENGETVEIVDWDADRVYAKVYCPSTGDYGYIRKTCLTENESGTPAQFYAYVSSESSRGYCYLYDAPDDTNGRNLGRYENGVWMAVIDWDASRGYAQVESPDGQIGYVHKNCLAW